MKCVHVVALAIEAVAAASSHTCLKVMLPQRCGGGAAKTTTTLRASVTQFRVLGRTGAAVAFAPLKIW